MNRVIFRTDSSTQIASGHLVRCLTLALELRHSGAEVSFICRDLQGCLLSKIEQTGFDYHLLTAPKLHNNNLKGYESWLGVDQKTDADETIAIVTEERCDLLIVDHYALDHIWEKKLRPYVNKIMIIDDLANRYHDCDFLLDQNYFGPDSENRYQHLVSSTCTFLLGTKYALLQSQYSNLCQIKPEHTGKIKNILIFFGGTDCNDYTSLFLSVLSANEFKSYSYQVVIAKNHPNLKSVKELVKSIPNAKLYIDLPSLAGLMFQADLMIGAGGATTWERICLSIPSITLIIADNQKEFSEALQDQGCQKILTKKDIESKENLKSKLSKLLLDPSWTKTASDRASQMVDGLGAKRVSFLLTQKSPLIFLIQNESLIEAQLQNGLLVSKLIISKNDEVLSLDYIPEITELSDTRNKQIYLEGISYLNQKVTAKGGMYISTIKKQKGFEPLKITILTEQSSWVKSAVIELQSKLLDLAHYVRVIYNTKDIVKGNVCFILSFAQIIKESQLRMHDHNLVVHGSNLPEGKGWSPWTWEILNGKKDLYLSLFEAVQAVDAGPIYDSKRVKLCDDELVTEWRQILADETNALCLNWIKNYPQILKQARPQIGAETFYKKRMPQDSQLDENSPIIEQFNLLRVVDNERYPAYFEKNGIKYELHVFKRKN